MQVEFRACAPQRGCPAYLLPGVSGTAQDLARKFARHPAVKLANGIRQAELAFFSYVLCKDARKSAVRARMRVNRTDFEIHPELTTQERSRPAFTMRAWMLSAAYGDLKKVVNGTPSPAVPYRSATQGRRGR